MLYGSEPIARPNSRPSPSLIPPHSLSLAFADAGVARTAGAADSMTSGYDSDCPDGEHLRRLLDQRAARADIHGRFPSLSEFSDSPSIYSHAYFSPRPAARTDTGTSYHHTTHIRQPSELRSPMSDRQRLNIPEASSLDLDDDPRNSYMTAESSSPLEDLSEDESATEEADADATEVHRVSAYGPKMTVHSRAPWETEEDDDEQEEPDSAGIKGAFKFTKRDVAKKPWGRDIRSTGETRPSFESVQSRGKQSFDTTSSHVSAGGALLALAQASMSSTSLAMSSPQSSLREKLSLTRFRSRTPSNTGRLEPVDTRAASRYQTSMRAQSPGLSRPSPTTSEFSRPDSRPSLSDPPSPSTLLHHQHDYHPYANPDLVGSYTSEPSSTRRLEELHALVSSAPHSPTVGHSESAATITESNTITTMSTMSRSRSQGSTILTPDTSVSSMHGTKELAGVARSLARSGKQLGPIEVIPNVSAQGRASDESGQEVTVYTKPDFPSPSIMTPSWPQSPNPIPIKLITLEEAQAQARERSRSATATATGSGSVTSSSVRTPDPGFAQSAMSWTRMRSSSSSGNAKGKNSAASSTADLRNTPTLPSTSSLTGAAGAPPRTVVRKKSGFMRLFNSKEKVPASPPPVPFIAADVFSSTTVTVTPSTPAIGTHPRKQSTHRVPVPSLTPSLLVESEGGSGSSIDSRSDESPSSSSANPPPIRERQLSARRNLPGLSIVTSSSPPSTSRSRAQTLVGGNDFQSATLSTPKTTTGDSIARGLLSASDDPKSPEFITLSLRPVSTNFGELTGRISDPDDFPRPSLDTDTGTPTTGASVISPRSPSPMYRLEEQLLDAKSATGEDQSSVIRTLQEQIITARKAWQHQLWELEGQVRDLKAEVEELRAKEGGQEYCAACGRGTHVAQMSGLRLEDLRNAGVKVGGVVNRPRARTGVGSRFASGT